MEQRTAETAARRALKRFNHAARQLADAETESARKRHARRMVNAQRGMSEARRVFEQMSSYALD